MTTQTTGVQLTIDHTPNPATTALHTLHQLPLPDWMDAGRAETTPDQPPADYWHCTLCGINTSEPRGLGRVTAQLHSAHAHHDWTPAMPTVSDLIPADAVARAHGLINALLDAPDEETRRLTADDLRAWLDEHTTEEDTRPCLLHKIRHYLRADCYLHIARWRADHPELKGMTTRAVTRSLIYETAYRAAREDQ